MSNSQPQSEKELFLAALAREPDQRAAFLEAACASDAQLRERVEALLASHSKAEGFLESPVPKPTGGNHVSDPALAMIGQTIGHYHVRAVIAAGGMGIVYEALQEEPRRTVALKVMRRGVASRSALRRFHYEAQILGRLRHPGIAQIYEAGTHDDGSGPVPYFAMEYIPRARTIVAYADAHGLGTRQRLELFATVCEAVHHGHQKGIIHRDLKPANILVDSSGQPKVIDFGVARATDSDLAVTTQQTDIGHLIGTVQYMSPEQCDADPHDLDVRSDVYSLGVVLYELLCGRVPYDVATATIYQATRLIKEAPPQKPSTINRELRGDVETIVLKTLEKHRPRRYQSALELVQDIRRYLSHEPIVARPPSVRYQLSKFVERHKVGVAASIALAVALVGGTAATVIGTSLGLIRARRAEAQAVTINEFLKEMLSSAESGPDPSHNLGLLLVLEQAVARIDTEFAGHPELEAAVRETIGTAYRSLGHYDEADEHLRAAVRIRERLFGDDHPLTLTTLAKLGALLRDQGRLAESEALLRRSLAGLRRVAGDEARATATAMGELGATLRYEGKLVEAEPLLREGLEVCRAVFGEDHPETLRALNRLGSLLMDQGRLEEAERVYRRVLEAQRRRFGSDHLRTSFPMGDLARVLGAAGRPGEAEPLSRHVLEVRRRVLGEAHPDTLRAASNHATDLGRLERWSEAEQVIRATLEHQTRTLGEEHRDTLTTMNNLAYVLRKQGRFAEATVLARRALDIGRRAFGDEHEYIVIYLANLARVLRKEGKPTVAEPLYREALDLAHRIHGADHHRTFAVMGGLGACLKELGRFDEAETLLLERYEGVRAMFGAGHNHTHDAIRSLIKLYQAAGRPEKVAEYRMLLPPEPTTEPAVP